MKNPRSEKAARLIGRRRGSALMMLIMTLALLIGTYSATMVRKSNNAATHCKRAGCNNELRKCDRCGKGDQSNTNTILQVAT